MTGKSVWRLSLVALAVWASIPPANAMDDDTATQIAAIQQQLGALSQRLDRLESQQSQASVLLNLQSEIDALKSDNAQLHGLMDEQTHELAVAEKRQTDLYQDVDTRLRALAQNGSVSASAGQTSAPAQSQSGATSVSTDSDTAQVQAYQAALTRFKQGDYAGAVTGFKRFMTTYPTDALVASAQYWIGNAYFATKDFKNAQLAQQKLISAYPKSPKVPDAMLNLSSAQIELGDMEGAHKTLTRLVARFPDAPAAAIGKKRLQLLQGN